MPDIAGSCRFMAAKHGDLAIAWDEAHADALIPQIQALMDSGISFFILDESSKARQKPLIKIDNTSEITGRQVFIRDPDIARIVQTGLAQLATFAGVAGVNEIKTVGKAKTAAQAARSHTVAVPPKAGG